MTYWFVEKYRSSLTKKDVDYLTNFKWQGSNTYCALKVHKCKSIQEGVILSTDDNTEISQSEDLKQRPIISGPESPTQRLNCLIENLLKPVLWLHMCKIFGIFLDFIKFLKF